MDRVDSSIDSSSEEDRKPGPFLYKLKKRTELGSRTDEETEALYGKKLRQVKDEVARWRTEQAREAFHIGYLWKSLAEKLPRASIAAFLSSECQIPRRDVTRYARLADRLEHKRDMLIEKGVPVNVMLDLAGQDEAVLEEALNMIGRGRCLQAKELAALKRDIGLGRMAREGLLDPRRARDLRNAAARKARLVADEWLASLKDAAEELLDISELGMKVLRSPDALRRIDKLADAADALLQQLPSLVDEASTRPNAIKSHANHENWGSVKGALDRISRKDIYADDDYPHPPSLDRRIDPDLVWELAWAFGYDQNNRPERLAATMRTMGQVPLDIVPDGGRANVEKVGQPTVLELCAGAGGLALGLDAAGFHHLGLIEVNEHAAATMRTNRPNWPVIEADVRELDLSAFEDVDLLAGGIPCQPYSSAGKRRRDKDERDLFPETLKLIRKLKPKAIMIENVTGALDTGNAVNRLRILGKLTSIGYDAEWRIVEGVEFGLPQKRRRAILVGFRPGIMHRFRWPIPLKTPTPTVGSALRKLMGANGWKHVDAWSKAADKQTPTLIGGSQKKNGIDLTQKNMRQAWIKLGINPSYKAATAPGPDAPADHLPRLTFEMMARLQDFPDRWAFEGPNLQVFHQITNALPPCMARAVGASVMRALTGSEVDLATALSTPIRSKGLNLAASPRRGQTEELDAIPEFMM